MQDFRMKVLELHREENGLSIGLQIKGPYNVSVRAPKIAVVFDNGKEKRRIPVLIQAYFPTDNAERFVIFAKYAYDMEYIFYKRPENNHIQFYFEVIYGDTVLTKLPFTLSSDVKLSEDHKFKITCNEEKNTFDMQLRKDVVEEKKTLPGIELLQGFFGGVWGIFLLLLSIPLLPVFFVESFFALAHCVKTASKNEYKGPMFIFQHIRWRVNTFTHMTLGLTDLKKAFYHTAYKIGCLKKIRENSIVFISSRRTDLTGNFEFVHNLLKTDENLQIRMVLDDHNLKEMSFVHLWKFGYYAATSKVILVDDFTPMLYHLDIRPETKIIQLWHACGAFKTFGYGRLGKQGGQKQSSPAHRNYDYAIVSSSEIAKFYAEGFGISLEKAVATGVPRTDIFYDADYKARVVQAFYEKYPKLKDKKIILFAPTFRGNGKVSGFYPVEKFNVEKLYESLHEEYAIIIKHHPFVQDRNVIPEKYADYILDLSNESELNDLLFVTDLLITDYSSVVFEASLLQIPMLFYAFDLQRYISTRGFYYEYEQLVPGKIATTFKQMVDAIACEDFETEKQEAFRSRFFDDLDGKATERTVALIYKALKE